MVALVKNQSVNLSNPNNSQLPKEQFTAKIQFEKIILTKQEEAPSNLRGSVSITKDDRHQGYLHKLIFIGQFLNALFTGHSRKNINLCHGELVLDVTPSGPKKGNLILAHAVQNGIKTTSENHKKDKVITGKYIYRPVDEKMRDLFVKYAEQTSVNFEKIGLKKDATDFKSRVKREVPKFSFHDMFHSIFHRQVLKPIEEIQKSEAYAAADLLRGDKFRDQKGEFASFFCSAYLTTLMQATTLVSALSDEEQASLKTMSRDQIAQHLLNRIRSNSNSDRVTAVYRENEFMQLDARYTMSYALGDLLDKSSERVV